MSSYLSGLRLTAVCALIGGCLAAGAAPLVNTSPADATAIVQRALDGGGEVVLSRAGSPWNVGPLFLRSNTHLILESGAELVAKTNAFFPAWDRLLTVEHVENVTISGGSDSTIRMRREDYLKPPYVRSEHRHAIGVYDSTNVVVEGLIVTDSGGDGLCTGRKTKGLVVRDCDMNRNHRQGISICTGEDILIERCKLRNTKGTAPQAGIDYEPNEASDCIVHCVLRDCVIENNRGQAIEVNLSRLRTKSRPVSLTVENCRTLGGATSFRVRCGARADDFVAGFIRFRNCTFTAPRDRVFWLGDCPCNDFTVSFENCTVADVPPGPRHLAWFESGVLDQTAPDGFDFGKMTVRDPVDAPLVWHRNPGIGPAATHFAGELAFENLGGKAETVKLDAAWAATNLPPMNGGRPLPKRLALGARPPICGDIPQNVCSNNDDFAMKYSNIVFGGRTKGIPIVFYAPKEGEVRLKIRRLDSKGTVSKKPFTLCWLDGSGKGHGRKSYSVDPSGVQEIVYDMPKRGYCLLETPWRGGRYVLESANVEAAFDVRSGALRLSAERRQTLELGFDRVPGEAVLFVEPAGTDPATVEILNESGECVLKQSVAGRSLLPLPGGQGRWSVRLTARRGSPSAFFDLYGTTPLFFIPMKPSPVDLAAARIVCANTNAPMCRLAASELASHLTLAAGARSPSSNGCEFVLGARPAGSKTPEPFESVVTYADGRLWFYGDDGENRPGTLFAVYEFLDRSLGVTWPFPGDGEAFVRPHAPFAPTEGWTLAPADAKRFQRLCLRAEHALLAFDFFMTGAEKDEAAFQAAAKRLHEFRLANFQLLGRESGAWYGNRSGEAPLWKRTDCLRQAVRVAVPACHSITNYFGVREGDKVTSAIEAAMAACEKAGGGYVLIPHGTWLTGAVRLRSNCELRLEDCATLEFSDDPSDYPEVVTSWEGTEQRRLSPLIFAANATNVAITGKGVLSARLGEWARRFVSKESRPQFIQFNQCRDIRLENFRICGSPSWMIHLYRSDGCRMADLDCCALGHNNDGVDVEMSRNVVIERCRFDQGDDGIAVKSGMGAESRRNGLPSENVTVRDCWFGHCHGMLAIGSELSAGIRNVTFENCHVEDCGAMVRIKTTPTRGGFVEGITVRNCSGRKMHRVFDIMADYSSNRGNPAEGIFHTPIKSVLIDGIDAAECEYAYRLHCDAECPPEGVTVRNVRIVRRHQPVDEIFHFPATDALEGVRL